MRCRGLSVAFLAAFLSWIALPLLHVHEERGHGGEDGEAFGGSHASDCVVCELLSVAAPGLEPASAQKVDTARPATGEAAFLVAWSPRAVHFSLAGAPRGPPSSSLA